MDSLRCSFEEFTTTKAPAMVAQLKDRNFFDFKTGALANVATEEVGIVLHPLRSPELLAFTKQLFQALPNAEVLLHPYHSLHVTVELFSNGRGGGVQPRDCGANGLLRTKLLPRYARCMEDCFGAGASAPNHSLVFYSFRVASDGTLLLLATQNPPHWLSSYRQRCWEEHEKFADSLPFLRKTPMDIVHISLGRLRPLISQECSENQFALSKRTYEQLQDLISDFQPITIKLQSWDDILFFTSSESFLTKFNFRRPVRLFRKSPLEVSLGSLTKVKPKILLRMMRWLSPREMLTIGAVSHILYSISCDHSHWRYLVLNTPGYINPETKHAEFVFHKCWKATFFQPRWSAECGKPPYPGFALVPADHVRPTTKQRWYTLRNVDLDAIPLYDTVPRVSNLSRQEFIEKYEKPNVPVVITGAINAWAARKKWHKDEILKHYGDTFFKTNVSFGSKESKFRMSLKQYFTYCEQVDCEKPIYIFDKKFQRAAPTMLEDYTVPQYFDEDLLELMTEEDRPDYRWLLIGPRGSGSPYHTDPHRTNAWNAVLSGAKRVSFYPPDIVPPGVDEDLIESDVYPSEDVIEWYTETMPELSPKRRPMECVVREGDVLFIPSGWWHQVLNLETPTVAVTQNYTSPRNLELVVSDLKQRGPKGLRRDFARALKDTPFRNMLTVEEAKRLDLASPTSSSSESSEDEEEGEEEGQE